MVQEKGGKIKKKTKSVALMGMFVALAFVLSFVEAMLPISVGIPGVKIGLANLVVIVTLFTIGPVEAFGISLVRIILAGFTFGSFASMLYSLAGGMGSYLVMLLLKRSNQFSEKGISVAGGVTHNVGQIMVAIFVVENSKLFFYLPVLILTGSVAGYFIGILANLMIIRVQKVIKE